MNELFFPQMVLAAVEPRNTVPQILTGESKRVISQDEWNAFEELKRRPRKPGTNEYLTESIVKGVDKTGK